MTIFDFIRKIAPPGGLALVGFALLPAASARAAETAGNALTEALLTVALICAVSLAGLGWYLYKKLSGSLTDLESHTRKLADGNLQELVSPETTSCKLAGRIGENVNELALNLQEVLLLVWNLSRQDLEALARAETLTEAVPNHAQRCSLGEELAFMRQDLEEMRNIVRQFEFYNVILQEEKLLAKPEPATSQD